MKKIIWGALFFWVAANTFAATAEEYYNAGLTYYQQGQYDQAAQFFQSAVQTKPGFWQAYQMLGSAYFQKGDKVNALTAYQKSLELNSNNPELKGVVDRISGGNPQVSAGSGSARALSTEMKNSHPVLDRNVVFLRLSPSLTFANGGDTGKSIDAWKQQNFNGTYSDFNTVLLRYGGELIFTWDHRNAIGLETGSYATHTDSGGMYWNAHWGFTEPNLEYKSYSNSFSMNAWYLGLNYQYFVPDRTGRWFAAVSARYYHVSGSFSYKGTTTTDEIIQGGIPDLSGDLFGGALSVGREFPLFSFLGIMGSLGYQFAGISELKSKKGDTALVKASNGAVGVAPVSMVGTGGLQYAGMDLSGPEARLGLEIYF